MENGRPLHERSGQPRVNPAESQNTGHTSVPPAPELTERFLIESGSQPQIVRLSEPAPVVPDPYPFDEVVDSGNPVRFNMDGNQWCAVRLPFTNLQETPAGFGDTPMQALVDLIHQEIING